MAAKFDKSRFPSLGSRQQNSESVIVLQNWGYMGEWGVQARVKLGKRDDSVD